MDTITHESPASLIAHYRVYVVSIPGVVVVGYVYAPMSNIPLGVLDK